MRRIALIVLTLLATVGVVTACSKPEPAVAFYADGHDVSTLPAQYCNANVTACYTSDGSAASLTVPAGSPLQISVAPEIASTVWLVLFRYKDASGAIQQDRSAVFPAYARYAYTLTPPTPSDQLTFVQVEQIGAITMSATDTEPNFQATRVWTLNASA